MATTKINELKIHVLTQAQYDSETKAENDLYLVTDEDKTLWKHHITYTSTLSSVSTTTVIFDLYEYASSSATADSLKFSDIDAVRQWMLSNSVGFTSCSGSIYSSAASSDKLLLVSSIEGADTDYINLSTISIESGSKGTAVINQAAATSSTFSDTVERIPSRS